MSENENQIVDERRVNFFIIDNIIFDFELDTYDFTIYCLLVKMSNSDNKCFPSYDTIAEKIGCSKGKVVKSISSLEQKELIEVVRQKNEWVLLDNGQKVYKNGHNIYKIKDISKKQVKNIGGHSKSEGGHIDNVGGHISGIGGHEGYCNNTTLNNTNLKREREQEEVVTQKESEPSKPSSNNSLFLDFEINMLKAYSTLTALTHISSYDDLWKHDIPEKRLKRQKEREMLENAVKNNLDLDITAIMRKVLVYAKNNTKDSNLRWYTFKSQLLISISEASERNIALQNANQSQINQARQRENEEALREEENKKWYETYTTMFDITESELDRLSRMKFDDVCMGAFVLSGEDDEAMHNDLVRYITENKHKLSQIDTEPSKSDTDSNYTSDVENLAVNQNVSISDVVNNMNYKSYSEKPDVNRLLKNFGIDK